MNAEQKVVHERLSKLESKIDKLVDAVTQLVKVEQIMINYGKIIMENYDTFLQPLLPFPD